LVNGDKSGKGTCYDATGKLIYLGDFANDNPTGTYPTTGYDSWKFEIISYSDGGKYIGETKDVKRHGYGIYLWNSGEMWYGYWKDGLRNGYGIYIALDGSITTGYWTGDNYSSTQ
jgi:hypothetical protein